MQYYNNEINISAKNIDSESIKNQIKHRTTCFEIYKETDRGKVKMEEWELVEFVEKLSSRRGITATFSNARDVRAEEIGKIRFVDKTDIKYDWSLKNFNWPKLSNNSEIESYDILQRRSKNFPTKEQKKIAKALSSVPVYTVVNGFDELIISTPRSETDSNFVDWVYSKYYNIFKWTKDSGPIRIAPFFMHKEDAEMYMHEVFRQDSKHAEEIGVEIRTLSLDTFYVMNRTSPPQFQAKLISDLAELELIFEKTLKKSKFTFHPKQCYGKNWFQGTPIYTLKLSSNDIEHTLNKNKEVELVFFKQSNVNEFWEKFKEKNVDLENRKNSFIQHPSIQIYNLENYLLDMESKEDETIVYFLGDLDSVPDNESNYQTSVGLNLSSIKRFLKGIYWLLTSDVLPTEKNDW